MEMDDDQKEAADEFRHQCKLWVNAKDAVDRSGARYALGMAAEQCKLAGLGPSRLTVDGYDDSDHELPVVVIP